MKRAPIYVFKDGNSVGVSEVPLESIVQVIDSDGVGTPSMTQIINKSGINRMTTVSQYLAQPSYYKELDRYIDELNEITDISLSSVLDGNILVFDNSTGMWSNTDTIDGGSF